MKKLLSLVLLLACSAVSYAQNEVTQFLGIPVDGSKSEMIQKLKAKGFRYDSELDCLKGEFNGRDSYISVVTNNNKVYRIMVRDVTSSSESDIRIRFNTLCRQFENNKKYQSLSSESYIIPEDENISYEMSVNKKTVSSLLFPNSGRRNRFDYYYERNPVIHFFQIFTRTIIIINRGTDTRAYDGSFAIHD